MSTLLPVAYLLIAMTAIQTGASISKTLFAEIGVQATTAARLGIAALIMGVLLRIWRAQIKTMGLKALLIYGCSLAAMNIMFYQAIDRIPLGIAATIQFLGPLTVTILHSRQWSDLLWAFLATLGLLLILPVTSSTAELDPVGLLYAFGAAIGWGLYIVWGQKAGSHYGMQTAALGTTIAAFIAVPVGASEMANAVTSASLTLPIIGLAIAAAIISSVVPFTLEMAALRKLPAKTFGTLMSLEPAIGALVGWLVLHEILTQTQLFAIALIIAACTGATLTARSTANEPQTDVAV